MSLNMWFGTLEKMQYIPCALSELSVGDNGYSERLDYVNGGAGVVRSYASARQFDFTWSGTPTEINPIRHYQQGVYGTAPYYTVDPMTWHYNMLTPNWASPRLLEVGDWPNFGGLTPTFADTPSNAYSQPARTATWSVTSTINTPAGKTLILPIPPDKTLHVGFSGSATGTAVIQVIPVNTDGTFAVAQNFTLLSNTASTRLNTTFNGATFRAVKIYVARTSTVTSTISLTSGMAQLWDTGVSPTLTGNHIPGDGYGGLDFTSGIQESWYQAAGVGLERKGASVTMVEVEPWL